MRSFTKSCHPLDPDPSRSVRSCRRWRIFLNVIRTNGGTGRGGGKTDIWGRRRLAYEIKKGGKRCPRASTNHN